jgi:hypothetical protein
MNDFIKALNKEEGKEELIKVTARAHSRQITITDIVELLNMPAEELVRKIQNLMMAGDKIVTMCHLHFSVKTFEQAKKAADILFELMKLMPVDKDERRSFLSAYSAILQKGLFLETKFEKFEICLNFDMDDRTMSFSAGVGGTDIEVDVIYPR